MSGEDKETTINVTHKQLRLLSAIRSLRGVSNPKLAVDMIYALAHAVEDPAIHDKHIDQIRARYNQAKPLLKEVIANR